MSKVNFTLSSKISSAGKSQVLVRFVGSKTEVYRGKTGIFIKPENWDERTGFPKSSRREAEERTECTHASRKLSALTDFVCDRYEQERQHGKEWLTNLLSNLQWTGDEITPLSSAGFSKMSITASLDAMIADALARNIIRETSARAYRGLRKKFAKYEDIKPTKVREFNANTLSDFLLFVRQNYNIADNTVYNIRAYTARWWHWCQEQDPTLPNIPSNAAKVKGTVYGTPYYITKEQRDKLYHAPMPTKDEEHTRDLFVLQCLLGCRYSDIVTFTSDNIQDGHLVYIAKKTLHSNPQTIAVPLHPIAKEIIEKYKGRRKDKRLVPSFVTHHANNVHLRRAIKAAGIDCNVTIRDRHTGEQVTKKLSEVASSHMARRTFIGCLYEAGFRESDICSMSGHREGSLSIQRYRRVSDERKRMMIDSI